MKRFFCLLLALAAMPMLAQQASPDRPVSSAASFGAGSTLPAEKVGPNDLLGVAVYDSPELTRPVRVDESGDIRLPMVQHPIHVGDLYPAQIEGVITNALIASNVLVDPLVTVSVIEYRSRPITVMGAVRTPTEFQADGPVTLLDAISRAGGLAENAGGVILLSRPSSGADDKSATLTERIPVQSLLNLKDASVNRILEGGDIIRVPVAEQVYVLGTVKRPGAFSLSNGADSSVLKALALSGGLDQHPAHIGYIYREEAGSSGRNEIPVDIKKIVAHKEPDVALQGNDILYIPQATARMVSGKVLEASFGVAVAVGTTLLYLYH